MVGMVGIVPIIEIDQVTAEAVTNIIPEKFRGGYLRIYRTSDNLRTHHYIWTRHAQIHSFEHAKHDGMACGSGSDLHGPDECRATIERYIRIWDDHPWDGLDA